MSLFDAAFQNLQSNSPEVVLAILTRTKGASLPDAESAVKLAQQAIELGVVPTTVRDLPAVEPTEPTKIAEVVETSETASVVEPTDPVVVTEPASVAEPVVAAMPGTKTESAASSAASAYIPDFREIAMRSVARGEARVLPIQIGGKNPSIKWKDSPFDTASTDEWARLVHAWINEQAAKFPNVNVAIVAKPDEFLFIDEDDSAEFRAGYELFTGEDFPRTFATSARPNHLQSHWLQTDATRKMGNVPQLGKMIFSVRQHNYYVLAEGSAYRDGTHRYAAVDDSPTIPMPDKLVEYIQSLYVRPERLSNDALTSFVLTGTDEEKLAQLLAAYPDGSIEHGSHDNTLIRIAGKLRQVLQMTEDMMYPILVDICERCCVGYGGDYTEMCSKIAKSAGGYPIRIDPPIYSGGKLIQQGPLPTPKDKVEKEETVVDAPPPPKFTPGMANGTVVEGGVVWEGQVFRIGRDGTPMFWPDPEPFVHGLLPVLPFDLNFLPAALRPLVQDLAERIGVPLDFTGIAAISTAAGVTNRRVFVHPKQHDKQWKEPVAISGMVIAASGDTKTPVWKAFVNPVYEIQMDWLRAFAKKKDAYNVAITEYELALKAWEKKPEADKGEKPEEPKEPVERRLVLNDATPEKMHDIMSENPAGVFYSRDEISGWIAELDKPGYESARSLWLSAMTGDDWHTMDRIGRGSVHAIMSASVFGGCQPEILTKFLNETDNIHDGMVPRFGLLIYPDSVDFVLVDRKADPIALQTYRRVLRTLAELPANAIAMHFDAEAQPVFLSWLDAQQKRVRKDVGVWQSHLKKYPGLLVKLAGLFQLIDLISALPPAKLVTNNVSMDGVLEDQFEEPGIDGVHLIDLAHLNQAMAFLVYLESHMRRVYGTILTPLEKAERALADKIKSGGIRDGFTVYDVLRKHWSNLKDKGMVETAIEGFEERSWIRLLQSVPNPKGGRPTDRWEINTKLNLPWQKRKSA